MLHTVFREWPALTRLTPEAPADCAGILTLAIDPSKAKAGQIVARLAGLDIQVKAAQGTYAYVPDSRSHDYNAIRLSPHIFTDAPQLERLAEALHDDLR
jgi:selenocysteine lyase/cysteine desulfurase